MADVPLFRDTNVDAVTSRVNTLHEFSFTLKVKPTTIKISNSASLWTRERGELRNGVFVWREQTQNSLTGANTKQCLRNKKVTRIQGLYRSVSEIQQCPITDSFARITWTCTRAWSELHGLPYLWGLKVVLWSPGDTSGSSLLLVVFAPLRGFLLSSSFLLSSRTNTQSHLNIDPVGNKNRYVSLQLKLF